MTKINTLKDDYGNRAEIEVVATKPYKDATKREVAYRLSLYAEYDNDFLYFVSVYETMTDVYNKLKTFSCGTFRVVGE